MGIKGDTAKLRRIAKQGKSAFGSAGMQGLSRNLAEETVELVREGFDKERDPFGKRWAKLKYRSGRILQDTGRLRIFKPGSVTAKGFTVSSGAPYGRYHQGGTRRIPARKMVPDSGLPARWRTALVRVAKAYLKAKLR